MDASEGHTHTHKMGFPYNSPFRSAMVLRGGLIQKSNKKKMRLFSKKKATITIFPKHTNAIVPDMYSTYPYFT